MIYRPILRPMKLLSQVSMFNMNVDFQEFFLTFELFLYNLEYINNSALGFESVDIGHEILEKILRYV